MEPVCFPGFTGGGAGCQQQPQVTDGRLPVAWLEGEVLAEYVKFLKEAALPPPMTPAHPGGVEWMEGEVREEFLRFLADAEDVGPGYGRGRCAAQDSDDNDCVWRLLSEALNQASEDGGSDADDRGGCIVNGDGGSLMDEDEELEMLVPHILDLPAVRERAAAAAQQETEPSRPHQDGGWMQLLEDGGSDADDRGGCIVNGDGGSLMDEDEELEMLVPHILDLEEALDQAPENGGSDADDRGGCIVNGDGGSLMDEDEELEMLVPHILDLPAFRERAAAAAQQETEPPRPHQDGGWMQLVS